MYENREQRNYPNWSRVCPNFTVHFDVYLLPPQPTHEEKFFHPVMIDE